MNRTDTVQSPQTRCRVGVARCDITPPIGIYHRMWGAAIHDRATAIHRPLEATLLWLEPVNSPADGAAQLIFSLDHCILDGAELNNIRQAIHRAVGVDPHSIQITLTHTHGSGWMSRQRSSFDGGELIGPYLDELCARLARLAVAASEHVEPATIVYGIGRCSLAAHRDFFDKERGHAVCGFNPAGPADDTVLVGRITADDQRTLATLVNYACHLTTLAWDNTALSPDWVGAMRETVEQTAGGLCLFLQGASGDLGPREGFVGDHAVADRNGRQLGYAVLAALETLPPAGTEYKYDGPVLSGTWIGTWKHEQLSSEAVAEQTTWRWESLVVDLDYRPDLPTLDETTRNRDHWLQEEELARRAGDTTRIRDCRANVEQMTRQLARLAALVPGKTYPLSISIAILGDAIWVFVPGELYQVFQTSLRARFAPRPVVIATLSGDWQPGYIPSADAYGRGIYQEVIAATAPGALETLIEATTQAIRHSLQRSGLASRKIS